MVNVADSVLPVRFPRRLLLPWLVRNNRVSGVEPKSKPIPSPNDWDGFVVYVWPDDDRLYTFQFGAAFAPFPFEKSSAEADTITVSAKTSAAASATETFRIPITPSPSCAGFCRSTARGSRVEPRLRIAVAF